MNNKNFVSENLNSILSPKSQKDVTDEIKSRLDGKDLEVKAETKDYVIYLVKRSSDIRDIIKNMGGRDEDIFFNFYLILDNGVTGFNQILGIKVSPDGNITALNAKGDKVDNSYLSKFD